GSRAAGGASAGARAGSSGSRAAGAGRARAGPSAGTVAPTRAGGGRGAPDGAADGHRAPAGRRTPNHGVTSFGIAGTARSSRGGEAERSHRRDFRVSADDADRDFRASLGQVLVQGRRGVVAFVACMRFDGDPTRRADRALKPRTQRFRAGGVSGG